MLLIGTKLKVGTLIFAMQLISSARSSCLWYSGIALYSHPRVTVFSVENLVLVIKVLLFTR